MLENNEPTGNIEGIDADALLNEIEGGGTPADPGAPAPEAAQAAPQAPAPEQFQGIEFDYNGKPIKVPYSDPKVKTWAQQGYDYSQRMAQLKQEREQWENKLKSYEEKYGRYAKVDEYAAKNPDWWNYVDRAFQDMQSGKFNPSATPDITALRAQIINELKEELNPIKEEFNTIKERETAERIAKEDQALEGEIKSIRDSYPKLDWDSTDEQGLTLEKRVIKHAIDNKIESFKAAFRDYNFDHLLKLHEETGKEKLNQDLQKRAKMGIIGKTPTSQKAIQPTEGVKNKSYESLLHEAKSELGIA